MNLDERFVSRSSSPGHASFDNAVGDTLKAGLVARIVLVYAKVKAVGTVDLNVEKTGTDRIRSGSER